ncbi:DUF3710 domain-containing protein [Nocardioides sp. AE5]|uniref:DUF3710 domain-containing protein n=1 Tax=Nocardioides sp. AE5 TaxID=2962573 RepID=UPI002881F80C|nr:DUF3710 domain-containing protein [Nocardioides sp. AE5]MDT0201384.1 DUF3710 domain-containing protein [Nocardioides sp. AE5]
MKFARKSRAAREEQAEPDTEVTEDATTESGADDSTKEPAAAATQGPYDVAEVDLTDGTDRIDLGGMLVAPAPGLELRLQVEEKSGEVQSVLLVGKDGVVEFRAFAAPRNGDLWSDARQQIAADTARRGGTATDAEGTFGDELVCVRPVKTEDGRTGKQQSRVVGINGPRWMLRATFLGTPVDPAAAGPWEDAIRTVVVRRGDGPMAPGEAIPLTLPAQARRKD